ncbi:YbaY family lipoprotein [Simiduia curdlanivorans]|uniref:YbaY family lipoprotein n=1 Tax=Simiduia curdlanivorans TaxID=1492769 RepID=A0ABV8V4F6_9GAMM|nr:YbaY family lipoprotein [Simiduia curdlanivorans]MDN3637233.1 YbaY family lipoprotein [Simiduia curdlanivorans]
MHRTRALRQFAALLGLVLGVIGCDDASIPTQKVITGTAQLSEPSKLPPNSKLQVVLEDISRADIAAQPIADLEQDATQPLNFALSYNHDHLQPNRRYNLRGRIVDARGELLWVTDSQLSPPASNTPVTLKLVAVPSRSVPPQSLFYQCEKHSLLVKIEGESASLFLGERVFALHKMMTASGIHYQSEEADFWSKGDEAFLTIAGESRQHCTLQPQALSLAAAEGATLWASGNEPPWLLIRTKDDALTLTQDYGAEVLTFHHLIEKTHNSNIIQLKAESEDQALTVLIEQKACADTMSDRVYPLTLALEFNETKLSGCGQNLTQS